MHGAVFASPDAVSGALLVMIADFRTYCGQRIIPEEYFPGLHELVFLEELYHLRNWRVNGTAFLALRVLAVQAAFSFGHYVQWHDVYIPLKMNFC